MIEFWRSDTLPWAVGQHVICKYSHARIHNGEPMLTVEKGERGTIVQLVDGAPAVPQFQMRALAAYAIVEWPSGLRDAWSHPAEPPEEEDDE